jgi:hypothetical protein
MSDVMLLVVKSDTEESPPCAFPPGGHRPTQPPKLGGAHVELPL